MNQKSFTLAIAALALLVIGGAFWCLKKWQSTTDEQLILSQLAPDTSQLVAPIDNKVLHYQNLIAGIAFGYPKNWVLNEGEFEGGKGDGRNSLAIDMAPPNWDSAEQSNISIVHYPSVSPNGRQLDNLSVEDQLSLINCSSARQYNSYQISDYFCEVKKNENGVQYVWEAGYTNSTFKGYGAKAMVPTGKYVITFNIRNEKKENFQNDAKILEEVVNSVELK